MTQGYLLAALAWSAIALGIAGPFIVPLLFWGPRK